MSSAASSLSRSKIARRSTSSYVKPAVTMHEPIVQLSFWLHDDKDWPHRVVLNPKSFPMAKHGDVIKVTFIEKEHTGIRTDDEDSGSAPHGVSGSGLGSGSGAGQGRKAEDFLFKFDAEAFDTLKNKGVQNLNISIHKTPCQIFGLNPNSGTIRLEIVDPATRTADYVEILFKDQYIGRSDMWRVGVSLEDSCIHVGQKISFMGCIKAEIKNIYINQRKISSSFMSARTKTIYRSASARCVLFLQLCKEMYEFDEDGERYYEKIMHGFLPELFARWQALKTNHVVSIILFSRVYYDSDEKELIDAPIGYDPDSGWYKDFYKVCVDIESNLNTRAVITQLKTELASFQKEVLLDHHHKEGQKALILGSLSYAFQGNVLEALNLALNPYDRHRVDRDLTRTGLAIMIITPGTGYFKVDKDLLRLTSDRCNDHGLGIELICLNKMPLHSVPLFSFKTASAKDPTEEFRSALGSWWDPTGTIKPPVGMRDPLFSDGPATGGVEHVQFYHSVHFWIYACYWSKSSDKLYRPDSFIPRVKMAQVQNLGVLNHDLTPIVLPFLDDELHLNDSHVSNTSSVSDDRVKQQQFDENIFGDSKRRIPNRPANRSHHSASSRLQYHRSASVHSYPNQEIPDEFSHRSASPQSSMFGFGGSSFKSQSLLQNAFSHERARLLSANGLPSANPLSHNLRPSRNQRDLSPSPRSEDPPALPTFAKRQLPAQNTSALSASLVPPNPIPSRMTNTSRTSSSGSVASAVTVKPQFKDTAKDLLKQLSKDEDETHEPGPAVEAPVVTKKPSKPNFVSMIGSRFFYPFVSSTPSTPASKAPASSSVSSTTPSASRPASPAPSSTSHRSSSKPSTVPVVDTKPMSSLSKQTKGIKPIPSTPEVNRSESNPMIVIPQAIPRATPSNSVHPTPRNSYNARMMEAPAHCAHGSNANFDQPQRQNTTRSTLRPSASSKPNGSVVKHWITLDENRRWQHVVPGGVYTHQIKWKSMVVPACLPITATDLPSDEFLEENFVEYSANYPMEYKDESPFIKPKDGKITMEMVVREMAMQRLAQGFQAVVASSDSVPEIPLPEPSLIRDDRHVHRKHRTDILQTETIRKNRTTIPLPGGASEALRSKTSIFLSWSNTIHRLDMNEESQSITVRRYTRKPTYSIAPKEYEAMVWTQGSSGFQKVQASFHYPAARLASFNWSKLDENIIGNAIGPADIIHGITLWRTRYILIPSENRPSPIVLTGTNSLGETLSLDEIYVEGAQQLVALFAKARWHPSDENPENFKTIELLQTTLDPSTCWLDQVLLKDLRSRQSKAAPQRNKLLISKMTLPQLMKFVSDPKTGIPLKDLFWNFDVYPDAFSGEQLVNWLCENFRDLTTRERATVWGSKLFDEGFVAHIHNKHKFIDGNYIYQLHPPDGPPPKPIRSWFRSKSSSSSATAPSTPTGSLKERKPLEMQSDIVINLDPQGRSDRAETAYLHYDVAHNYKIGYHFEISWVGSTAQFIEEMRQSWSQKIAKYGLRLVESPIEQISSISVRNAFRSCHKIKLALKPPTEEEFNPNLPFDRRPTCYYFECALLTDLGFILDAESDKHFVKNSVNLHYHRKAAYDYSQFVHKSGLAFVQVLDDSEGFLWLENKMFTETTKEAKSAGRSTRERAAELLAHIERICSSPEVLQVHYDTARKAREIELRYVGC
ncbi:Uncharacterized conserved protein, contains DEP domain [Phaffia rhodozyma]|uniref:Vacuolar membrane-associated protein IML1 n=1 Tax=Phaffia rhodozyma TaxID=264483 RepID=A0A0F7SGL6_PHARH|nr:Uncharacterized conserved protein, contains DEP domain [Phaffia rhodozyma]